MATSRAPVAAVQAPAPVQAAQVRVPAAAQAPVARVLAAVPVVAQAAVVPAAAAVAANA